MNYGSIDIIMHSRNIWHYISVALAAIVIYSLYNFIYLPGETLFGDERRFIGEAIGFVETGVFQKDGKLAWEMPLTALIYSVIYYFVDSQSSLVYAVRLLQSLLLLLQSFFVFQISLKLFKNERAAFFAFVITLFYPFFIYYQALLLSENLFMTLLLAGFYFIYKWYEKNFIIGKDFFYANVLLVLAVYAKGTLSVLPIVIFALFAVINTRNIKQASVVFVLSLMTYCVLLLPWWMRNAYHFDRFIPFTTSSGFVLYVGNNSHNKAGGCDIMKDSDYTFVRKVRALHDELLMDSIFRQKAIEFIIENPGRFLELSYMKLVRYYNIVPNDDGFNQGIYKWGSLLSYGVIFLLSLIGIVLTYKNYRELSAIYILFLFFTLIHIIYIASIRYRLPLEPFMIILASFVLEKGYRKAKGWIDEYKNG